MKFKKIILITLLLLAIFTISSVSAADSNNTDELIASENYNSPDNIKYTNDLSNNNYDKSASNEDNSKNNILSSSDSENSNDYTIKKIYETEVYLIKPINENKAYILDSINKYPNTNAKFIIHINTHFKDSEGGTVSLKFNGKSFSADVYEGEAIIIAKTPSKVGKYKATLSYSGHTFVFGSDGYKFNPSSSTFTLNVKNPNTSVSAPKVTAYYKANKYFKVNVKNNGKAVKNLKLNLKVYTGSKYKNYVIKTNKNGVAKISTKKFKVGSHNVKITSKNSKYKVSKTSKIIIKKKSTSKYIIITTTAKMYNIVKKSGNFAVKTYIDDFTAGVRAPYKCIDIFLYKNGKQVKNTKYYTNYRIDGQWTGWVQYGLTSTAHHRYLVEDNANVEQIKVKVNKNVNSFY